MDTTLTTDPWCELSTRFSPCEFRIKWADSGWETRSAHALRRAVFCAEQGVFVGDDLDAIDAHAQTIVAIACVGGLHDQVVGTVRIHSAEPGLWWGSRLAVHPSFRRVGRIGATLIRLAVSSAHARGARVFLAHVQQQNVAMFEQLHWQGLKPLHLHGRPHQLMQAELRHYPPCHDPITGYAVQTRGGVMTLAELITTLRASRGFVHKQDIGGVVDALAASVAIKTPGAAAAVAVGDDCAAIPLGEAEGGGYLLLAIEGLVEDFIARMPWFAGYCSVMVNVSDIYAMGGRPIAVVDALWSAGLDTATPMLQGMAAASQRYGVPIVGGHSNNQSLRGQLAVAILGRAQRLLTSFDALPGDELLMAVDLRGSYQEPYPYWNASTGAPAHRLRADLEILPALAEEGLCRAAKDISMAGVLGTTLMLLECSRVGAVIELDQIPRPGEAGADGAAWLRWLTAFPSYGFILSVQPAQSAEVQRRFGERGLACACIGRVQAGSCLLLRQGSEQALLWDTAETPFITAAAQPSPEPAHA